MNNANAKETERLQKVYPLFKFKYDGRENGCGNLEVIISDGSFYHTTLTNGSLPFESILHLNLEHQQKSIEQVLMNLYQDLKLSAYANKDGILINVWVQRNNRDAESIGQIEITNIDFHKTLAYWNIQAQLAKREGWFFCSGHRKAELRTEYSYFYFAANYCKKYGEENPESLKRARSENYN